MIKDDLETDVWQQGEFEDYLDRLGFKRKFEELHPALREPVKKGIGALKKLDELGRQVVLDDKRILISDTEISQEEESPFRAVVKNELRDIDRIYHGERDLNWMNRSVGGLFLIATYTNNATRGIVKDNTFSDVDAYRRRLLEAGVNYQISFSQGKNFQFVPDEEMVREYLNVGRYPRLDKMGEIEEKDFLPVLNGLRPVNNED